MLDFGEELFDWVQVWGIFWQEDQFCAGASDGLAHDAGFMCAEIVHDDDVARCEGGDQYFFDIDAEALAIDRPVEQPWRIDAVVTQGSQEGHGIPMPTRRLARQTCAARCPSPQRCHIGFGPSFIDKNKAGRIKRGLEFQPLPAPAGNVGTILLAGDQRLFL